jgi:hypothetical protein
LLGIGSKYTVGNSKELPSAYLPTHKLENEMRKGRLPKFLKDEAMRILEEDAVAHERIGGTAYSVRVDGKFLCSEDTYDLRIKIEQRLRETR